LGDILQSNLIPTIKFITKHKLCNYFITEAGIRPRVWVAVHVGVNVALPLGVRVAVAVGVTVRDEVAVRVGVADCENVGDEALKKICKQISHQDVLGIT
jgi:hypothetical protein